jgi:hypothetical protein
MIMFSLFCIVRSIRQDSKLSKTTQDDRSQNECVYKSSCIYIYIYIYTAKKNRIGQRDKRNAIFGNKNRVKYVGGQKSFRLRVSGLGKSGKSNLQRIQYEKKNIYYSFFDLFWPFWTFDLFGLLTFFGI